MQQGKISPAQAFKEVLGGQDEQGLASRLGRALTRVLAKLNNIALLTSLEDNSCSLAVVLRIDRQVTSGSSAFQPYDIASQVKVVVCERRPELVGAVGYVVSQPDDQLKIEVAFDDGAIESFSVAGGSQPVEVEPVDQHQDRVIISHDGRITDCPVPAGLDLQPGMTVRVTRAKGIIVGIADELPVWEMATVEQLLVGGLYRVDYRDNSRVVSLAISAGQPQVGHRVGLDQSGTMILKDFGLEDGRFQLNNSTGVTFADIGGLDEAKQMLREAIIRPVEHAALYLHYKQKALRGALLFGPPGCGKTELGRAAASELTKVHREKHPGTTVPVGFLYVNASEILEHLVGKAEKTVSSWGDWGKRFYEQYGYRPVIFIDEVDAVAKKRGTGISTDATDSIVNALLGLLGGMRDPYAFFIFATNREDILDPALLRDGRVDRKIKIGRPDQDVAALIFRIHLGKTAVIAHSDLDELSKKAAAALFDSQLGLYTIQPTPESGHEAMTMTLASITSGAMIAGIVQRAASLAMDRDIQAGSMTGVTIDDLLDAVQEKFKENIGLNHTDEIRDFIGDVPVTWGGIKKLRQVR